jgi:hypothetical protein
LKFVKKLHCWYCYSHRDTIPSTLPLPPVHPTQGVPDGAGNLHFGPDEDGHFHIYPDPNYRVKKPYKVDYDDHEEFYGLFYRRELPADAQLAQLVIAHRASVEEVVKVRPGMVGFEEVMAEKDRAGNEMMAYWDARHAAQRSARLEALKRS